MGNMIEWARSHPRLASWIVLAVGMEIIVVVSAVTSDVNLLVGQWIALTVAVVAVAGLSIWIISWEDEEDDSATADEPKPNDTPAD